MKLSCFAKVNASAHVFCCRASRYYDLDAQEADEDDVDEEEVEEDDGEW